MRHALILFLLLAWPIGCNRSNEAETRRRSAPSRLEKAEPSPPPTEPRPEPPGTPIGTSDSLIESIRPKLGAWTAMWERALPGFQPDSLFAAGKASGLRDGYVVPLSEFVRGSDENQRIVVEVLGADSPDRRFRLIFDRYQFVGEESDEFTTGGDVDSAPLLIDRRLGIANQFQTCGTPCGFDWGAWSSSRTFVLGGWMQGGENSNGPWRQGRLQVYSLTDSTVSTYVTRFVDEAGYDRYRKAWQKWLEPRYRKAMKGRTLTRKGTR